MILLHYFFRSKQNNAYLLKVGFERTAVFCHMTSLGACGDGGWTLVMKMDGAQVRTSFIVLSVKSFIYQIQTCGVASLYISDAIFCVLIWFTGLPNTVKVMSSQSTNQNV